MASRRFRGKLCAYCATGTSTPTGDHVVPRSLIAPDLRADLPKVPCCERCNNRKSRIEHYIATVLPFGGRHATAHETLQAVRPRLAKNRRLARELELGMRRRTTANGDSVLTLMIETDKIEAFADDLVRGLSYHHWGERLVDRSEYFSALIHPDADQKFLEIFGPLKGESVQADLADGHLKYWTKRASGDPVFTLWRIEFLGGAQFSGDGPSVASAFWAIAGEPAIVANFREMILGSET